MYKDYPEIPEVIDPQPQGRFWGNVLLMTIAALSAIGFIAVFFWVTGAHAEGAPAQVCAPYKQVSDGLKQKFHEEETSLGAMMDGQAAIVLFTAPEGKTWTLVVVGINGRTCIVASGDNWSQGDMPKAGRPA